MLLMLSMALFFHFIHRLHRFHQFTDPGRGYHPGAYFRQYFIVLGPGCKYFRDYGVDAPICHYLPGTKQVKDRGESFSCCERSGFITVPCTLFSMVHLSGEVLPLVRWILRATAAAVAPWFSAISSGNRMSGRLFFRPGRRKNLCHFR